MIITLLYLLRSNCKQSFLPLLTVALITLSSCNEQQFFEKEFLEGAGVPDVEVPVTPTIPTVPTTPTEPTVPTTPTDPTIPTTPTEPTVPTTPTDPTDSTDPSDPVDPIVSLCGDLTLIKPTDIFEQNTAETASVDILWVVDDSGSMGDEQEALARNFDVFIKDFIKRDIDFKMAITTTDIEKVNQLNANDFELLTDEAAKRDENKFFDDFRRMIRVGTRGSGREQGLKTSMDFLNRFQSWLRTDSYLIVVYVSDEQDQSPLEVAEYVTGLQALKTDATKVKAYSIVTQEVLPNKKWESIGTRYMDVSTATNSPIANIHNDFHETLKDFSIKILELLDSFTLSQRPVTAGNDIKDDLDVKVESQEVDKEGYSYDEQTNAVSFKDGFIPAEGSEIEVTYQACVQD